MNTVDDVKIIPEVLEYDFQITKHTAKAILEHVAGVRKVSFYFDEKLIGDKVIPDGNPLTDDDCIVDIMREFSKTNTGVYADLFRYHSDKITLVCKKIRIKVESGPFRVYFSSTRKKGIVSFSLTTNDGKDKIECQMEANDFMDAFEKSRYLLFGMETMNEKIAKNISELADDKVMEIINW